MKLYLIIELKFGHVLLTHFRLSNANVKINILITHIDKIGRWLEL